VRDSRGGIVGLITMDQLRPVLDDRLDHVVVAGDICAPPAWLYLDDDLARAHQLFQTTGCPQVPVVAEREGGRGEILGLLDYRKVMVAFEREVARRRQE
jgi:hypothetical protein